MIETPRNVCIDNGMLRWSPVQYADGYNVHSGDGYVMTFDGQQITSAQMPDHMQGPYSVSAWVRTEDGSCHTPRSQAAGTLFEPAGGMIVDDRFQSLDGWLTKFPYWPREKIINDELQDYVPDAFTTGEGLTIHATKQDSGRWESGILTGHIEKSYLYGYFEADIEFDIETGLWPAFWLLNTKYVGKRPEIDILEMVGGRAYQSYHSWHPERNSRSNSVEAMSGLNAYGLLWEPGRLTWYINRMPVFTTRGDHVSDQEMYPILNLAVGGTWPGNPDHELEYAEMNVSSFRVWQ